MDNIKTQQDGANNNTSPGIGSGVRAGYCQECGCALTLDALHRVGNGVFCETCASFRQPGTGWQNVSSGSYRGGPGTAAVPPAGSGEANPVLAGLLGFIPGVGAMYNAQFGKGAMHLIVFVVLVALADNLNWVFWWLVWGWIFYQAFEAYHTARARRDLLPLPNPFGWNDIGERMGFARTSPPPPGPGPFSAGEFKARRTGANWAGYVPPRDPSAPQYSPFAEHTTENPYAAPYTPPVAPPVPPTPPPPTSASYVPTYTGTTPGQPIGTPPLIVGTRRFPVGAAWLIGLGLLFLMGNLLPEFRLSGHWFAPILLAALALWSAFRRWEILQSGRRAGGCCANLPGAMTGPAVLLTISVLLFLQAAHILPMHRSWPVLLVVWGTMLLLQRSAGTLAPPVRQNVPEPIVAPVRSTSGTGSLGL